MLNKEFFDDINSEDKAYWLGFIFADGYLSKRKSGYESAGINLSIKDFSHLQKFANEIGSNISIYNNYSFGKVFKACQVAMGGSYIYNRLFELGIKDKDIFDALCGVPNYFVNHFIRGIFDGDGSVYIHGIKYPQIAFEIACGDWLVADYLQDLIISNAGLNKVKVYHHVKCNCYHIKYMGNGNALKFANFIYHDSTVCLKRKYEVFNNILCLRGSKNAR